MERSNNLGNLLAVRSNNLNLIRFFGAISVIVCHAYPLSLGRGNVDILSRISGHTLTFGNLAVSVFFIASGFLISRSIIRNQDAKTYFRARVIRIFPPLILTVILSVVLLGLFVSKLSFFSYLFSLATIKYFLNILLIPVHSLPGVFVGNVYGSVVNGSLWTLPLEFICYIVVFVAFKVGLVKEKTLKYTIIPVIIIYLMMNLVNMPLVMVLNGYLQPMFMFYMGVVFYIYREKIGVDGKYFFINLLAFVLTIYFKVAWLGLLFFFPYLLLYLSFGLQQIPENLGRLGNLSYGIYLCAFPLQQTLVYLFGGRMNPLVNILLASILAIGLGYIIYYLAEKRLMLWLKTKS